MTAHRLSVKPGGAACFGYCSCGWSTGPGMRAVIRADHRVHLVQRGVVAPEPETVDIDDGSSTVTLEQYREKESNR